MQYESRLFLNYFLIKAPLVGTGIESDVALDSGVTIVARRDGIVDKIYVDPIPYDGGTAVGVALYENYKK